MFLNFTHSKAAGFFYVMIYLLIHIPKKVLIRCRPRKSSGIQKVLFLEVYTGPNFKNPIVHQPAIRSDL